MITCGPTGSTGQQIADEINRLGSLPMSAIYCTTALPAQSLTTDFTSLILGNAGGALRGVLNTTLFTSTTIPATGIYMFAVDLSAEIPNNVDVVMQGFLNGTAFQATSALVTGKGAGKPVIMSWHYIASLTVGDVITIRAKGAVGATTLQVMASSVTIKAE